MLKKEERKEESNAGGGVMVLFAASSPAGSPQTYKNPANPPHPTEDMANLYPSGPRAHRGTSLPTCDDKERGGGGTVCSFCELYLLKDGTSRKN